ncbi:MAG: HAD family phosphatase [Anaerolineae bacterium]|nr:HAD family phosphatase [Anaerolineae bacterium]
MTNQFTGVIFDMDGTLVDSEIIWHIAEAEMFADRGIAYTDAIREHIIGMRLDEMFIKLTDIVGLTEPVHDLSMELQDRMLALIPAKVKAKPGAQEIIEYVAGLGIPYCIASSSPQSIIDATVVSQGWSDLIPHTYSADVVALGKPAPDIYLYAADQLSVDPAGCLALEDSPAGSRSAVAAGMTCYAVPDSHSDPAKFREITPHVYRDLFAVLENLRQN